MFSKKMIVTILLTVGLFVLAACGGASTSAPAEPTVEAVEEPAAAAEATEAPAEESAAVKESEEEAPSETSEAMRAFVVVPDQSTASYLVNEEFFGGALDKLGINAGEYDVVGSTQNVSGQFELNLDEGTIGANEFTVQIDTLSTDQNRRDNWVRDQAPGFAKFPVATFVADSIESAPDEYSDGEEVTFQLSGELTVRNVSVPITFDVTATLAGDTITGVAIADSLLSDFGISPPNFANTLAVEDAFQIKMELTAVEE